jgi:hypothetical protein
MHDQAKAVADAASIAVAFSTVLKLLPAIAALFSIVWTGLRIYDWFADRRKKGAK